jgi:hypothetical protein
MWFAALASLTGICLLGYAWLYRSRMRTRLFAGKDGKEEARRSLLALIGAAGGIATGLVSLWHEVGRRVTEDVKPPIVVSPPPQPPIVASPPPQPPIPESAHRLDRWPPPRPTQWVVVSLIRHIDAVRREIESTYHSPWETRLHYGRFLTFIPDSYRYYLAERKNKRLLIHADIVIRSFIGPIVSYYMFGSTVAIVSPVQGIDESGNVTRHGEWVRSISTLAEAVHAFFRGRTGLCRVLIFVLTDKTYDFRAEPSISEARVWYSGGYSLLSERLLMLEYGKDMSCQVLVYEFERKDTDSEPKFLREARVPMELHLKSVFG